MAGKQGADLLPAVEPGGRTVVIVDIRGADVEDNPKEDVLSVFSAENGPRKLTGGTGSRSRSMPSASWC